MSIKIALKNNKVLCLTFGRNLPFCGCIYLIHCIIEEYNDTMNVVYAKSIFGLFEEK